VDAGEAVVIPPPVSGGLACGVRYAVAQWTRRLAGGGARRRSRSGGRGTYSFRVRHRLARFFGEETDVLEVLTCEKPPTTSAP